jgi:hypothetical protein
MPDKNCENACNLAYEAQLTKIATLLTECLLVAEDDAARETCKERFRAGRRAARDARDVCLALCNEA